MTPEEVAQDEGLIARFQNELAYADRALPTEEDRRADGELLRSPEGLLAIAWLWPERLYLPERDPFELAEQESQSFLTPMAADSVSLEPRDILARTVTEIDRRRRSRRTMVSERFAKIIESVSMTLGCSSEDVMTHLVRTASLSRAETLAALSGRTPIDFSAIIDMCQALQLRFEGETWLLVDPQRLTRRIEQSVMADAISRQLGLLPLSSLESLAKKVPKGSAQASEGREFDAYRAPQPGGRYRSVFEALAADPRERAEYALDDVDRILIGAGESPLPPSARRERSWWAGSGTKLEGRPQVSAWWGAGYRVGNIVMPLGSNEFQSIVFSALPGRQEWLADPDHASSGEFPAVEPVTVSIWPNVSAIADVLLSLGRAIDGWKKSTGLDDPDIRDLIRFVQSSGEVDRDAIEARFADANGAPPDPTWMSNLLTRARRQGWIVNRGTRSKPRWAPALLDAE